MIIHPEQFDFEWFSKIKAQKRGSGNPGTKSKTRYKDIITAFDIETTTIQDLEQAVMYIWQWQFGSDITVIGRTWDEFNSFTKKLEKCCKEHEKIVAFVHNLSFEFQFLKGIYKFKKKDVFAIDSRKVLKCNLRTIEFRCSYLHSNMGLDSYLKQMRVKNLKLSGEEFDYKKQRFSWTELTEKELEYCINDVKGLVQAITEDMNGEGDNIYSFPLTSTGYVRRDTKRIMRKVKHTFVPSIYPDYNTYTALKEAFRGGNTHANRYYADKIIEDVSSADRSSSYPDVLCNQKFPISRFVHRGPITVEALLDYINVKERACLMRVALKGVKLINRYWGCPYISFDKCRHVNNGDLDNGRILSADYLETTITDIDFRIIISEYDFDDIIIYDFWHARYGYLPRILVALICEYYTGKTSLKGVDGAENEYMRSKAKINSVYGMMVQDPGKVTMEFNGIDFSISNQKPEKAFEAYRKKAFLSYPWGVWCTAWARWMLEEGIRLAGDNFIYCDTDSVKYTGEIDWSAFNNDRIKDSKESGAFADDPKGNTHYMGVFEFEETYKQFATLGAKKYCYVDSDDKLHLTVSGVSKKKGAAELKDIKNFKPGFCFKVAGGTESIYNDTPEITEIEIDGHIQKITSNVVIAESEYTLGLTAEYERLIRRCYYY